MLHSLPVMDLICFTEFPYTLFASNISGFKLTLLSRVLKRLHVCCVRLKGVDILTDVVVVFYADEILLEIRHSLWKSGIWNRENVEGLLNFIRSKFIVASVRTNVCFGRLKNFSFQGKIQRDLIIIVHRFSCIVPVILVRF